jgi:type VI secretion system Hcp family effector
MPTFLCLTLALTVGTFTRAQDRPGLNIDNSIVEASSVMQIKRSNIGQYANASTRLTITKKADDVSPQLLQAHNSNQVIPQISLKLYKPGDNSKYKVVTLENVSIAGLTVRKGAKDPNSKPVASQKGGKSTTGQTASDTSDLETVSFTFKMISIVYFSNGSTSTSDDWTASNN